MIPKKIQRSFFIQKIRSVSTNQAVAMAAQPHPTIVKSRFHHTDDYITPGDIIFEVVHDVDLQKIPVKFAINRAGLVGVDGPTHFGTFDTTFMACLPNMVVMAPSL